jgi:hypothetical protein
MPSAACHLLQYPGVDYVSDCYLVDSPYGLTSTRCYLPDRHPLRAKLMEWDRTGHPGETFYQIMAQDLARYQAENGSYNLELVELHLNRSLYMIFAKVSESLFRNLRLTST